MPKSKIFKVAAIQAAPEFLDKKATVKKACELIAEAGKKGAKIVVFPEAFIPAYPDWVWVVPPFRGALLNNLYNELLENSVSVPDDSTKKLCEVSKKAGVYTVIGINERNSEKSNSSIFNTMLYIGPDGKIAGKHRKLVPTNAERLVWAPSDGYDIKAYDTPFGRISGLICWENYMPLARYAVYSSGTQIYAAPTWDQGEAWLASIKHIAREGGVFVISCCIAMKFDTVPDKYDIKSYYPKGKVWLAVGNSAIVSPIGEIIAGPVKMKEEIIYADLDLSLVSASKRVLDVAGHYDRPDVFDLRINSRKD